MTRQVIVVALVATATVIVPVAVSAQHERLVPVAVSAQHAPEGWEVPRLENGRPDLQGIWASDSATPLQRPEALADRTTLTNEEVAALRAAEVDSLNEGGDAVFGDTVFLRALASLEETKDKEPIHRAPFWSYSQQWMGGRWFDNRTSLVIDPSDGRLPAMTPEAEERRKQARARRSAPAPREPETPTQELARLDPGVLCRGGNALLTGRGYNSNYQIFQTTDLVAIRMEMYHESRFIPIGDTAPNQTGLRSKMGSSRGYWDGDTLVIETSNLSRGTNGSTRDVQVTEQFTRVGPETLQYEYTLDDPSTWTRPWTARLFMRPASGTGAIYEYACHEGNYAAELVLRSARATDAEASQ